MRVLMISGSTARLPDPVYPLGAAVIATVVRQSGHEVACFDALRSVEPVPSLAKEIERVKPEVILMSIRNIDSGAFPNPERHFEDHLPLVACCREHSGATIILGGSGFSLMPEAFIAYLGAEIGVVGEGETVIAALLDEVANGTACPGVRHAKPSLGGLVQAKRDLFDAAYYYLQGGVANVQTKRGCAFNCVYCTYPLLEGDRLREADAVPVVDEMEGMVRSGIRDFFFVDAVFNRPESHAAAVCEEIIRRELDITFTAYFATKGDLPEFPSLLKRAGCNAVEFGTDSLSDPVLASLRKGFTVDEAMDFSRRIDEVGIPQCHNLILGGPSETEQTMNETIARLDEIDPRAVIVTIGLRVFPGTELEQIVRASGEDLSTLASRLEPLFYVSEAVSQGVVEKAAKWVDERRGWICPGLGKRMNERYLNRQRLTRGRKGVLWTLF